MFSTYKWLQVRMGLQHYNEAEKRRGPYASVKRMLGYPEWDDINGYAHPETLVAAMPLPPGRFSCLNRFFFWLSNVWYMGMYSTMIN